MWDVGCGMSRHPVRGPERSNYFVRPGHGCRGRVGLHRYPARSRTTEPHPGKEPSMLVLSRQRDETIMIGDDIEITVVDIRGDKVRLGITAPTRIAVHRKEVYEAIKAENQRASQINGTDLS